MADRLKIAIPKGYLLGESIKLLEKAGYDISPLEKGNRKLYINSGRDSIDYIISRPMDVPVYVEYGACDIGFAGKDVLEEKGNNIYELLDLKNGECRLILATLKDGIEKVKKQYQQFGSIRVATSYPNIAKKYFDEKGMQVELIKLHGSVELAPLLGMAEEILDITSTGETLTENDLVEMESIMSSTTRLIANITSYRVKYRLIKRFIDNIRKIL